MQIPDEGRCPHCDGVGEVGQGCSVELCQRKGYHFVPLDAYEKLAKLDHRVRNPTLGTVIDRYLLVSELGRGGFGIVYLALQLPIKMKAALKLVHRADSPEQALERQRRFLGEAQSLARLNHPNIVRMLQYDCVGDQPYLVMELVPGGRSLDREIAARRLAGTRFEVGEIERIASQVASALDSAHAEGVIHRDLKPENLMLQEVSGDSTFVRILDFGLAKLVADPKLSTQIVGTPAYMAPEQLSYEPIGPWTDFYALGVICVLLLTGRSPFPGVSTERILALKLNPTYDPLSALSELDLPEAVRTFVQTALATSSELRYRDAASFLGGLRPALAAWDASTERGRPALADPGQDESGRITSRQGERVAATTREPRPAESPRAPAMAGGLSAAGGPREGSLPDPAMSRVASGDRAESDASVPASELDRHRVSGKKLVIFFVTLMVAFTAFMFAWPYLGIGVVTPPPERPGVDPGKKPGSPAKIGAPRPTPQPGPAPQPSPAPGPTPTPPPQRVGFLRYARILGGSGEERIAGLARDKAGRVIGVGYTSSRGSGQNDGWIVAFDPTGKLLWQRTLGGGRDDELLAVTIARDGDIVAAGYRASTSDKQERAWIVRLAPDGKLRWEKLYESQQNGRLHRIVEAKDGGLIAAGYENSKTAAWLLKTDATGKLLFQKALRGKGSTVFNDVAEMPDGDIVAVGYQRTGSQRYRDFWVARFDAKGATRWQKFFGAGWKNKGEGVAALADGSLVAVGYTQRPGSKRKLIWVLRLSAKGEPVWKKSFAATAEAYGNKVVSLADDAIGIAGTVESRGGWVLKLALSDGRLLWDKHLPVANGEALAILEGGERELWVGGTMKALGRLDTDAFLVRLTVNGNWVGE